MWTMKLRGLARLLYQKFALPWVWIYCVILGVIHAILYWCWNAKDLRIRPPTRSPLSKICCKKSALSLLWENRDIRRWCCHSATPVLKYVFHCLLSFLFIMQYNTGNNSDISGQGENMNKTSRQAIYCLVFEAWHIAAAGGASIEIL